MNRSEAKNQWENFMQAYRTPYDSLTDIDSPINVTSPFMYTLLNQQDLACLGVYGLIREGHIQKSDSEDYFDPESDTHVKLLNLANIFFKNEDLKKFSTAEKLFFLNLTVEYNHIKTNYSSKNISSIPESKKSICEIAFISLSLGTNTIAKKFAYLIKAYNPLIDTTSQIGLFSDAPLSLEETKKCCEGIDKATLLLVLKNPRFNFSNEAKIFLREECLYDHKSDGSYLENSTKSSFTNLPLLNLASKTIKNIPALTKDETWEPDPTLRLLTETENKASTLAEKLKSDQLPDHIHLLHENERLENEINLVTNDAGNIDKNVLSNLEIVKHALDSGNKISETIAQDIHKKRAEKQVDFQMDQSINLNKKHTEERKKTILLQHFSPSDLELFTLHVYKPNGSLHKTIEDCQKFAKEYRITIQNLRSYLKEKETLNNAIHGLSIKIDENDQVYIDLINKARLARAKSAKGFGKLAKIFRFASALLTMVPGINAACYATAGALQLFGTVANIGQENAGSRADKYARKIQARINESHYLQQKLGQLNANNVNEILNTEHQLYHAQIQLLNGQDQFTSADYRKELKKTIKSNISDIKKIEVEQKKLQEDYEKAKKELDLAQAKVNEIQNAFASHCKCKGCKKLRTQENEAEQNLQKAQVNFFEAQDKFKKISKSKKKLKSLKNETSRRFEDEKKLRKMKDHVDAVVYKELDVFDFHRGEDKKLSIVGKAQECMQENLSKYNEARKTERELGSHGIQALRGLASEVSALTKNKSPVTIAELIGQMYQIRDRYKHFVDFAIPQYEAFKLTLQNNKIDFSSTMLHGSALLTGYLIPAVQLFTAGLSIYRLTNMLFSREPQTNPEYEELSKYIDKSFEDHRNLFEKNLKDLKELIDDRFGELNQQILKMFNFINDAKKEIIAEIRESSAEANHNSYQDQWTGFRTTLLAKKDKLIKNHIFFQQQLKGKSHIQQKELILTFLNKLLVNEYSGTSTNGKSIAIVDDISRGKVSGKKIKSGLLPYIAKHPKYFTGVYASEIHKNDKINKQTEVLSGVIFLELRREFYELEKLIIANEHLKVDEEISDKFKNYEKLLQKQNLLLENLLDQIEPHFIHEALNAQNECMTLVKNIFIEQKANSHKITSILVNSQIDALALYLDSIENQTVRGEKYFISERINNTRLHNSRDPLNLNRLHEELEFQKIYEAGMLPSICMAGAVAFPAGPLAVGGAMLLGGIVGIASINLMYAAEHAINVGVEKIQIKMGKREIETESFYNRCEAKIIHKLRSPLKKYDETARLTRDAALHNFSNQTNNLPEIKFSYELNNVDKELHLVKSLYQEKNKVINNSIRKNETVRNGTSLLKFDVTYLLQNLTYKTTLAPDSHIQIEDFEQIKTLNPITQEIKDNETKLFSEYSDWLLNGEKTLQENQFFEIIADGELTPSLDGSLLPLIIPKKLLQEIERILFAETLELKALYDVLILPAFDFKLDHSKENYIFSLQYNLIHGNTKIEFCSFDLATFDKLSVDCFRKVSYTKNENNFNDFEIGPVDFQEFLLQAMYAGNFQVPLPGKGTFKLQNVDLCIPNPTKFEGLFNLWQENPVTINYISQNNSGNSDCFGLKPHPQYFISYFAKREGFQKNKSFEIVFDKAISKYNESYYLALGMLKLQRSFDGINLSKDQKMETEHLVEQQLNQLGLFSPKMKEDALFNFYLHGVLAHHVT